MGRPRVLDEVKMVPVMLDKETREIIEAKKGDRGVSSFIRDSIRMRIPGAIDSTNIKELKKLKEENSQMLHELESYRNKEKAITKERQEVLGYIAKGFNMYLDRNPNADDPSARHNWLSSRCKDTGVNPSDVLVYVESQQSFCEEEKGR